MRSLYIETMIYTLLCLAIYFAEPRASELLAYYHNGIAQFELWRLITATFCHTNLNHLLMNLAGLIVILGLFANTFKNIYLYPIIAFSSIFIGLTLFVLEGDVIWYVGFSGVLHALFSYGVANDIQQKDKWGYLLATGLIGKIIYEQFIGAQQSTVELIGAPVLVNAHLYGVISGILFYTVMHRKALLNYS